ncbi:DUF3576 domain-containing protein [Lutimaribacter sp. EGI FJ00015]|uniref:DUF3576 domain-containing protein n=1 Tax=Lutimaribacter degradans TaxID=2945989 RepID=A0ACC5ZWK9_9RHOB|nr:DUF3576 domain-containing protein [Lutimaribacter sp. EGI FJ00013]MCM2562543.1 DUF3576 domain-containing protein [Lutimaribacter sp. EGI FJ00013]MCO0613700.1 DUF3576 domain-containing protein [Lutimaribacter sp. EGI FJ00015]MCO0636817.1 DUF3576 domain-containing protein [Lutimaribacter sp. EGI FJ00014]
MTYSRAFKATIAVLAISALTACGSGRGSLGGGISGPGGAPGTEAQENSRYDRAGMPLEGPSAMRSQGSSIWDAFRRSDPDVEVAVNRYLWNASLDVLNFMPVQSVDPFTGVIVFGYGTPPGGGRSYRATVYIKDPALDARSLVVALQNRGGQPVAAGTRTAVEDAILARARELRIADRRF